MILALEGTKYCKVHSGAAAQKHLEKGKIRNYMLTKWQDRLNQLADNDKVKDLREEIGVLRLTLEAIMERCQDQNDILMYSNKISDLAVKIEKIVASCHRLEASTGQLLDKTTAINFAAQVVEIVGRHVTDSDSLDAISGEVMTAVGALSGSPKP